MLPSASAYTVLLDELVCNSMIFRNSARLCALVRVYDWVSAFTGFDIRLTLNHLSPCRPTIGPCCVKYTVKARLDIPPGVRYGTLMVRVAIGTTRSPWR